MRYLSQAIFGRKTTTAAVFEPVSQCNVGLPSSFVWDDPKSHGTNKALKVQMPTVIKVLLVEEKKEKKINVCPLFIGADIKEDFQLLNNLNHILFHLYSVSQSDAITSFGASKCASNRKKKLKSKPRVL